MRRSLIGLFALAALSAACAAAPTATPSPSATPVPPTATVPVPTATAASPTATAAPAPTATTPAEANATVRVQDNSFSPRTQRVKAGGTVTWTYSGESGHTVTDTVGGTTADTRGKMFDKTISQGELVSFTFQQTGSYSYICRFHNGMAGAIVVE
jgi:plastocyanin